MWPAFLSAEGGEESNDAVSHSSSLMMSTMRCDLLVINVFLHLESSADIRLFVNLCITDLSLS